MQKLDDVILKKGDIVDYYSYVNDDYSSVVIINDKVTSKHFQELNECKIIKVQHPIKFETIYEAYEAPKQILDKTEKRYLENFLRPFINRVESIKKGRSWIDDEYIIIYFIDNDMTEMPTYKKDTMYKGMKLYEEYTLEELGLFKE